MYTFKRVFSMCIKGVLNITVDLNISPISTYLLDYFKWYSPGPVRVCPTLVDDIIPGKAKK